MEKTATTFNTWMSDNAAKLMQRLSLYQPMDEDAFQDAYLTLAEAYATKESCATFEKAFLATYRRFSLKHISDTFKTCHPDELFFTLLPSEETEPMEQRAEPKDNTRLLKKVTRHIRNTFPSRDVIAFEMKLRGFSCRDIEDALGIGTTAINNAAQRITAQTRQKFAAVAL